MADTPSCVLCSRQAFFWVGIGHSGSAPGPLPGCLSRPINLKFLRGRSHAFFSGVPAAPVTVRLTHQEAVGWESLIPGTQQGVNMSCTECAPENIHDAGAMNSALCLQALRISDGELGCCYPVGRQRALRAKLPEAALQPFNLDFPPNSGNHCCLPETRGTGVPCRWPGSQGMAVYSLLAFPLGEQRPENHQIDDGLFAG